MKSFGQGMEDGLSLCIIVVSNAESAPSSGVSLFYYISALVFLYIIYIFLDCFKLVVMFLPRDIHNFSVACTE